MKKVAYLAFIMFSYFYLTTATTMALPYSSILRWVGSFLLLTVALLCLYSGSAKKINIKIHNSYLFLFLALLPTFLGFAGDATFYSYGRIISLFLVVFGLQFFFDIEFLNRDDLKNFFEIYTFISGFMMMFSIISQNYVMDRLAGVYANANQLSCIAAFTLMASIAVFFLRKGRFRRWLYLIFAVLSLYCVLETGSRMGSVCAIVTVLILPFVVGKDRALKTRFKQLAIMSVILVVALVVASRFEIVGLQRLMGLFKSDVESSIGLTRGDTWSDVYAIFSEKPIWGWGYAQVSYRVFEVVDTTYNWGVHSSYFVILCEMGIVGSLLFLAFFVYYFYFVIKKFKMEMPAHSDSLFIKFMLLICAVMLLNAYSESYLFSLGNPMAPGFWIPFVIMGCYLKKPALNKTQI